MSARVSKISKPVEHIQHSEILRVALKYSKYSESDIDDELVNCIVRDLVKTCQITPLVPTVATRGLLTSVYLYGYDVLLEDSNSTAIAISAQGEVAGSETVDAINMTAVSDQVLVSGGSAVEQEEFGNLTQLEFNITDDEYFTFDSSQSGDIWITSFDSAPEPLVLAPPPPSSSAISPGILVGVAAGVAVMAGLIGWIATRRTRKSALSRAVLSQSDEFMVSHDSPLIDGNIDYSINPIHNNVEP